MGGATSLLAIISLMLTYMAVLAGTTLRLLPPKLVVTEGETVTFTCTPVSPLAYPILTMNNALVITNPRLKVQNNVEHKTLGNFTYTFCNVNRHDNGTTFRCSLAGLVSNTISTLVIVPPKISGVSGLYPILEGSSRTLNFQVTGDPFPHSLTWLYRNQPFTGSERITIVGNTSLVIQDASRLDSGTYIFVATNSHGQQSSIALELQVLYDEFLTAPHNVTLMEGEMLTQDCLHRFGQAYTWRVNGIHVNSRSNKVTIRNFGRTLHYGPVDYTDHLLQIRCIAHFDSKNIFVSAPGTLRVRSPPHIRAPRNLTTVEGDDITLRFSVVAEPPVSSLTFHHNELQLSTNAVVTILPGGTSLIVRGSPRTSTGNYTLVAHNSLGSGSASVWLNVLYAPDIYPLQEPVVAQVNRSIMIPCGQEVAGNPVPTFAWQHQPAAGNEGASLDDRSRVLSTGMLLLGVTNYSDAGSYTCTATNSIGSTTTTVNVIVLGSYTCTATNSIESTTTTVNVIVLDPPSSPINLRPLQIGSTWAHVQWEPPSENGSLPLSNYKIVAFPLINSSNDTFTQSSYSNCTISNNEAQDNIETNAACNEVECRETDLIVSSRITSANVTGLIPALMYLFVVTALSNGTNLESEPSNTITFITDMHVPGVGSVQASVYGPGSMEVTWTLAYSGGLPVLYFELQFQKLNDTEWQKPRSPCNNLISRQSRFSTSAAVVPHSRLWIVNGLESEELYSFRVRAVNELGEGEYVTSEPVLSHPIGVPSQPTQPNITAWGEEFAVIDTLVPKIGSSTNFSVTTVLLLNGTEVTRQTESRSDIDNGTESTELELVFSNLSYRGEWQFQVMASNVLGNSEYSLPSNPAQLNVVESTSNSRSTVGAVMGVLNLLIITTVIIVISVMIRKSRRHKKSLTRRFIMAQASVPFSSQSPNVEPRYSPDGRSNTQGTPMESLNESARRRAPSSIPSSSSVMAV